jgi:hypothetical protein
MQNENSQMPADAAGGAQAGGAWQQKPPEVCNRVKQLVDDLRSDLFAALTLDAFVIYASDPDMPVTKEDVKTCLKYDDTVKFVSVNGKEVLWLWDGWRLHDFVNRIIDLAKNYTQAIVIPEC